MRFEHQGMCLWYGAPDAPAPSETVPTGTEIPITIAVQPADASNRVEVLYRMNGGPTETASARWLRNDPAGNTQYYRANLPALEAGDTVEYTPICHCAGRQVPSSEEAQEFASSFRAVGAEVQPVGETTSTTAENPMAPRGREELEDGGPAPFVVGGLDPQPVETVNAEAEDGLHRVEGQIFFDYGLPAENVTVRLYNHGFGDSGTQLGDEVQTDAQGHYDLPYDPGGKAANLEVRVVDAQGQEISLSATKFGAGKHEVLNLVAPAEVRPLEPEYKRLTDALKQHLDDVSKLAEAREDADHQDLTLLHQPTGCDARLIALAADAVKAADETEIPQETLYALFRTGLPTDKQQLASVSVVAVNKALDKAREAGIVNLDAPATSRAITAFEEFARKTRRETKAAGAPSSFGDLLDKSGLDDTQMRAFEDLYFAHRGEAAELWQKFGKALEEGVQEPEVEQLITGLRLQGKLAYLTLNNADLIASLQQEIESPDGLSRLVEDGLYKEDSWKARLNDLADHDEQELQKIIPPAYAGEQIADRLDAYAADLARKVRLSFPTQVVGQMIGSGELELGNIGKGELRLGADHEEVKKAGEHVRTFLQKAGGLGFELGLTPVDAFVKDEENREELFENSTPEQEEVTILGVKKLQRLNQITPTDEALGVLLDEGFFSAQEIASFSPEAFVDSYGDLFGSREEARLVYRKAQQVSAVTYNVYTLAQQLDSSPEVYAMSASAEVREKAKEELIKRYPTMESLFGSLDFCECEHCRSVLSPAAYFVDLLQFLDPNKEVWTTKLAEWKAKRNGERYQKDWDYDHTEGEAYEDERKKPYFALIERRPDLPHLQLTCENTNTALPYIDVVNEILEYYVASRTLEPGAVHNTGGVTTPELLAEPQNILPGAYYILEAAPYPLTLPFDLWLETTRRFLDNFETPLWRVLEIFRPADELFAPSADPKAYYRAAIFSEQLGISPSEYEIFTSPASWKWHELYGYAEGPYYVRSPSTGTNPAENMALDELTSPPIGTNPIENTALHELKSAKTLSRRLGVSYKELVALLRTWFVNPDLDSLVVLRKLGVDADDVFYYKEHEDILLKKEVKLTAEEELSLLEDLRAFEDRLEEETKTFNPSSYLDGFDAKKWLDKAWTNNAFDKILLLADPDAGCNFDETTLRYANGDPADALVFLKINLFVRLWKKLGWTMEETDRALRTFVPRNSLPLTEATVRVALKTALVYLAHLGSLAERLQVGKDVRMKLLSLWANLPTTGENPLYAQLFLTQSALKSDAAFDDPLGKYLRYFDTTSGAYKPFGWDASKPENPKTGNVSLKSHLLALQGALNLTTDEVGRILEDADSSLDAAALTLANVSLLYRYGLLAKALKLTVRDLIALKGEKGLSGRDPFKSLIRAPLTTITDDHPFTQTLRFVEIAEEVKESGFRIEDLEYLLRHRLDPAGEYRPDPDALLGLVKSLGAEIRRIKAENAVPDDPATLTEEMLRQKLALVLPADVVETFFGFWRDTIEFSAVRKNVAGNQKLDPATYEVDGILVAYDPTRQQQRVTHVGVLTAPKKARILKKVPVPDVNAPQNQKDAYANFTSCLDEIAAQSQPRPKAFFDKYFQGFLTYDDLYGTAAGSLSVEEKRQKVLRAFVLFVQEKLIRQFVAQTISTGLNADLALTESLLTNAALLKDPSQPAKPLLDAFAATAEVGLTAKFFTSTGGTGDPKVATVPTADTSIKQDGKLVRPLQTNSARFEGYFEVPAAGAYRFFAVLGRKDAEAELRLAHLPDQPVFSDKANVDGAEISGFVELRPEVPYRFTFDVRSLDMDKGDAKLLVQGEALPKDNVDRLTLYPEATVERARRAHVLLAKTLQLVEGLTLSEREVLYLLTHATDFGNLDLSKLPTREADDSDVGAKALFGQFLRLARYARLKGELSEGTDDLISVVENARRTHPDTTDIEKAKTAHFEPMARLTRREADVVRATAEQLDFRIKASVRGNSVRVEVPALARVKGISRLWETLGAVEKLGVPAEAIVGWTGIVGANKTSAERFDITRDLKSVLKARYEPENWLRIARPIFDGLRQRQRDALVAHVMHQRGFERVEQLFEDFLIDPGMEPVAQTSRLRLAISSVQLFIQRCLLNLEKRVHPSVINSEHWQWMKRYRVWEANRKIFLFAENFLEPEFRDDKTHLFQELESALLQGDVSNDLAEDAFFNYLKKLEEIARLDMVAMYLEEKPAPASKTLHVIGRTYSLPHKYFYRRYADRMWTPWEPVTAEIEGDHVVAIVWRERLHLFWVTFLEKPKQDPENAPKLEPGKVINTTVPKEVEVQLNWSEYFQGQWTSRESSGFAKPLRTDVPSDFKTSEVFIYAFKEYEGEVERAVNVELFGGPFGNPASSQDSAAFRVVSKNSAPEICSRAMSMFVPYLQGDGKFLEARATRYVGISELSGPEGFNASSSTKDILRRTDEYSLLTETVVPLATGMTPLYRIRTPDDRKYYYYTTSKPGRDALIGSGLGYLDDGIACYVHSQPGYLQSGVGTTPLYWLQAPELRGSPFYTNDKQLVDVLVNQLNFEYRDVIGHVPENSIPGTTAPLYRLHKIHPAGPTGRPPMAHDYLYTTSTEEREQAKKPGHDFNDNGVACDVFLQQRSDSANSKIGALPSPFFYQDNQHTFFVEPSVDEPPLQQIERYVANTPLSNRKLDADDYWEALPIKADVPAMATVLPVERIAPVARFKIRLERDWLTNPATVLQVDKRLVGQGGSLDFSTLPARTELTLPARGLTVVGNSGLNPVLVDNLDVLRGSTMEPGYGLFIR